MFNTDLHIITVCFLILQILISIPVLISWLKKKEEKFRIRYFNLLILFILYNVVSGLTPNPYILENFNIDYIAQEIIAWAIGISWSIYFLYYLYKEYRIIPSKMMSIDTIMKALALNFLLFFIIPYTITKNIEISRNIFLVFPIYLSFIALYNIFKYLKNDFSKNKNKYYRTRIICGGLSMFCIVLIPIFIVILGDIHLLEHSILNMSFAFITITYILRIGHITSINNYFKKKLSKENDTFQNYLKLDHRERELLYLMLDKPEYTYKEIIKKNHLDPKMIKVMSNKIFFILNIINKKEATIAEYSNLEKYKEYNFTSREIDIIELILKGKTYNEISDILFIAVGTVSKHASNAFSKAKVDNKEDFKKIFD